MKEKVLQTAESPDAVYKPVAQRIVCRLAYMRETEKQRNRLLVEQMEP